jgi:KDO2-lipid IV(A) lauroyltransferase
MRHLSPAAARGLARGLGRAAWRLGVRREVADANLAAAFPELDRAQRDRIARASYEGLVLTAAEFLRLPQRVLQPQEAAVRFEGWEHFEAARRAGRGAIVASAHMGNWELYGAAAVARGMDVTFVVQRLRNLGLDEELCARRRGLGLHVLDRGMALRQVPEHLRRNRLIAMMCDQDARQRGVFVSFLGRPASTHKGAAQLAYRNRVPLIPFLGVRLEDGTHQLTIHPPLRAAQDLSEDAFIRRTMQDFHDLLATTIREHPGAYLWQHRRWKTAPPPDARERQAEALRTGSGGPRSVQGGQG